MKSIPAPGATREKAPVKTAAVPLPMLRRWRREVWQLTGYCSLQVQGGWYAKDCIESGVPKRSRCRLCKVLGEIDDAIAEAT